MHEACASRRLDTFQTCPAEPKSLIELQLYMQGTFHGNWESVTAYGSLQAMIQLLDVVEKRCDIWALGCAEAPWFQPIFAHHFPPTQLL